MTRGTCIHHCQWGCLLYVYGKGRQHLGDLSSELMYALQGCIQIMYLGGGGGGGGGGHTPTFQDLGWGSYVLLNVHVNTWPFLLFR